MLDEPTSGLHSEDGRKPIDGLHRPTETGKSVVVIELDLGKNADQVVDLGPPRVASPVAKWW